MSRDVLITPRFVVGSFDQDALVERRAGTDQGNEMGRVDCPPPASGTAGGYPREALSSDEVSVCAEAFLLDRLAANI